MLAIGIRVYDVAMHCYSILQKITHPFHFFLCFCINVRFLKQFLKMFNNLINTKVKSSFYLYFQRVKISRPLSISLPVFMSLSGDETFRGMCTADGLHIPHGSSLVLLDW